MHRVELFRHGGAAGFLWKSGIALLFLLGASVVQAQTVTVTSDQDFGKGTLRAALKTVNNNDNPEVVDVIAFKLPGTSTFTIELAETDLPAITQPVRIDGATQAGYDKSPRIVIDGGNLPDDNSTGLILSSSQNSTSTGSEIIGLSFVNFQGNGLSLQADSIRVSDCYVGLDAAGNTAGNRRSGIYVASDHNELLGNVISANSGSGVNVYYGNNNQIQRNYIGVDPAGTADVGNEGAGVLVKYSSASNVIAKNTISGNDADGVRLQGGDGNPTKNTISGNDIGIAGGKALPNDGSGIGIDLAFGTAITSNRIAFNGDSGIQMEGTPDSSDVGNRIRKNRLFENTSLGIDLGGNGRTYNDVDDSDSGPNDLQNFPEIDEVLYSNSENKLTVTYRVPSKPQYVSYPLTVDFYRADADREEGDVHLGLDTYTRKDFARGSKTITITPLAELPPSSALVAAATSADDNTSEFSTSTVPLEPTLNVSLSSLAYGGVAVGTHAADTLDVTNTGNADLEISSIAISGAEAEAFSIASGGDSGTLSFGETRKVVVQFAPERTGGQQATLVIESNAGTQKVDVDGEGMAPEISIKPQKLEFEAAPVNDDVSDTVSILNTGNLALKISGVTVSGSDADAFSITSGEEVGTLKPGQAQAVVVRFAPSSSGEKRAALVVESSIGAQEAILHGSAFTAEVASPESPQLDTDLDVIALFSGSFEPTSARLFYREAGQNGPESYASTSFLKEDTALVASIPSAAVTLRGVEYYARFTDGQRVITVPKTDPRRNPMQKRVAVTRQVAPLPFSAHTYRMISIPLALKETTMRAVLQDDLGPPGPKRWRFSRWNPRAGQYEEPSAEDDVFSPGRAFWIITQDTDTFDVDRGRSVASEDPYVITLEPGWNQIGNPFAFPVAWDSVAGKSAKVGVLRPFNGGQYGAPAPVLRPWEGYFVENTGSEPVELSIPPVEASERASKKSHSLAPQASYVMRLRVNVKQKPHLQDTWNVIGFASAAASGNDPMDIAEPPGRGDNVRLSIIQHDKRLDGSFKPKGEHGQWWDLEIGRAGAEPHGRVDVNLEAVRGKRPEDYRVYVFDKDTDRVLAVDKRHFSIRLDEKQPVRRLRLVVGTPSFAKLHSDGGQLQSDRFDLAKNYPNPFSGGEGTTIHYRLGRRCHVALKVYNALGQRVATLVDAEQTSGAHSVQWQEQHQASGVYFYRIQADTFVESHKMTLLH